jgi:hypothetical protein
VLWLLGAGLALATPDAVALKSAWNEALPAMRAGARIPVTLPDSAFATLAQGGVARVREDLAGADRVLGAVWTDAPRDALWIAILDDQHFTMVNGLYEEELPGTGALRKLLYQRLDLPWPLQDRQWVIDIRSNAELWARSGGAIWERAWTLADPALEVSASPDAVWSTTNEGGWLLVDAAGGTLAVYHVRAEIGGNVPDEASTQWAWSKLDELMRGTVTRARTQIPGHYDAAHDRIARPDGSVIPPMR